MLYFEARFETHHKRFKSVPSSTAFCARPLLDDSSSAFHHSLFYCLKRFLSLLPSSSSPPPSPPPLRPPSSPLCIQSKRQKGITLCRTISWPGSNDLFSPLRGLSLSPPGGFIAGSPLLIWPILLVQTHCSLQAGYATEQCTRFPDNFEVYERPHARRIVFLST